MKIPSLAAPAIIFFSNALLFISLFSRLPELVDKIDIDKGQLGLAFIGGAAGTFLALPTAARLVIKATPRLVVAFTLPAVALVQLALYSLPAYSTLLIAFFLFGYLRTVLDVAQNITATHIESTTGEKVMARSHGFWSVGLLVGSMLSSVLATLTISGAQHMMIAGVIVVGLVGVYTQIAPTVSFNTSGSEKSKLFVVPSRTILVICAMMFGLAITEGAVYDWGAFYIQHVLEGGPETVGLLFSFFTIGMAITRMSGDALRKLYSSPTLVRLSAVLAASGVATLLPAPNLYVGALALAMIGAGIALNAPLAVSTASRAGGSNPADNITALSTVNTIAFLGVPALLGFIADGYGLRVAFSVLLPVLVVSFLLAPITSDKSWVRSFNKAAA